MQLDKVLNRIKNWTWNDPVSELYKELFTKEVVFDIAIENKEALKSELKRRYDHKIPPGYKDQSKVDDGIGDLLIWLTILEIGRKFKKSIVFVSGEEKSDWVLKSEGQVLCPRFELITEFSSAAPGQSFHIIKFSELLQLMAGPTNLINEIKEIERNLFQIEFAQTLINYEVESRITQPITFEINVLLSSIRKTIIQFISSKRPDLLGNDDFMDDLTSLHRNSILPFNIYKRLMNLYAIYRGNREGISNEAHIQNLDELRRLKMQTFEALANAFNE